MRPVTVNRFRTPGLRLSQDIHRSSITTLVLSNVMDDYVLHRANACDFKSDEPRPLNMELELLHLPTAHDSMTSVFYHKMPSTFVDLATVLF